MTNNILIEKAVNRVHKEHEGKGQHEKQSKNDEWTIIFKFKEQIGCFNVGGLFRGRNNAFFSEFIANEKCHRT